MVKVGMGQYSLEEEQIINETIAEEKQNIPIYCEVTLIEFSSRSQGKNKPKRRERDISFIEVRGITRFRVTQAYNFKSVRGNNIYSCDDFLTEFFNDNPDKGEALEKLREINRRKLYNKVK